MTKETVWMPVYIGDYLGDTQRLTTEQHGAYFLLLMDYWRCGPPPADDAVLCSITRLKLARFRKHKTTLLSFFQIEGGKLRHRRVDAEITKAKQNHERNSARASKAAQARWDGPKEDAPSNATSNATSNPQACPSPSPSFPKGKAKSDPAKKALFDNGLALLVGAGGSEGSARSYLGKCRKDFGDAALAAALAAAALLDPPPSDPKAWLQGALRKQANDGAGLLDSINRKYGTTEAA